MNNKFAKAPFYQIICCGKYTDNPLFREEWHPVGQIVGPPLRTTHHPPPTPC